MLSRFYQPTQAFLLFAGLGVLAVSGVVSPVLATTVSIDNPDTVLLHVASPSSPSQSKANKVPAPVKLALAPVPKAQQAIRQEKALARTISSPVAFNTLVFSITQSYLETLKSGWTQLSPEALMDATRYPLRGNNFDRVMAHTRHSTLTLQVYDRALGKEKPPATALAMRPPVMMMRPKAMTTIQSPYANIQYGRPGMIVGGLIPPLRSVEISSPYGPRWGRMHTGIDLSAPMGTPFYAAGDGRVVRAEFNGGYGLVIDVQHSATLKTRYAHCSSFAVFPGMPVKRGQYLGNVGSSGNSTGPHLHFEVLINGFAVNPQHQVARL